MQFKKAVPADVTHFNEYGYAIIRSLFDAEEMDQIL